MNLKVFIGDIMYLYKHKINYLGEKKELDSNDFKKKVEYKNHEYSIKKYDFIENIKGKEYFLLWFERISYGLKEGEIYYWQNNKTGEKQEISEEEYESLKQEFNYYVCIDNCNCNIFSYNTSDSQKNIVHKHLLKNFLNLSDFVLNDEIDLKELLKYSILSAKITYKNVKQEKFKLFKLNIFDKLKKEYSSEFSFDQFSVEMKGKNSIIKDKESYGKFLESLKENDEFLLTGKDENDNDITIENQKMNKKEKVNSKKANHNLPDKIYTDIKEFFENE